MVRYTHAFREDEVAAVAKLPDLAPRFEEIILEKSGLSAGLKAEDLRVAFRDPQGGKPWIKGGGAVDSKGVPNGEDTPENTAKTKGLPLKIRGEIGGPPGNRTPNLRIKSPLLCLVELAIQIFPATMCLLPTTQLSIPQWRAR